MSFPLNRISPESLLILSVIILIRVVLPEPFGPKSPYTPSVRVAEKLSSALIEPYGFQITMIFNSISQLPISN